MKIDHVEAAILVRGASTGTGRDEARVEWQGVPGKLYTIGVTADAEDVIVESDESNNQASRILLVARHAAILPLVVRQW